MCLQKTCLEETSSPSLTCTPTVEMRQRFTPLAPRTLWGIPKATSTSSDTPMAKANSAAFQARAIMQGAMGQPMLPHPMARLLIPTSGPTVLRPKTATTCAQAPTRSQ